MKNNNNRVVKINCYCICENRPILELGEFGKFKNIGTMVNSYQPYLSIYIYIYIYENQSGSHNMM